MKAKIHQIHLSIIILKFRICVCVGEDSFAKGNYYQGAEINWLL